MADGGALLSGETFTPGPDTALAFRHALGRFATGVTVVTALAPHGPVGITANSFASVSLDPPLVLWSPARQSSRYAVFATAERFAIHILAHDQHDLCRRFVRLGHEFDGLDPEYSEAGIPLLRGCLARFECATEARHDGGDHLVIIGRVLRATVCEGRPLVFSQGAYGEFAAGV